MTFKTADAILKPDERFHDLCVVEDGVVRRMTLLDHHAAIAGISTGPSAPADVVQAFDRARNTLLYAYFDLGGVRERRPWSPSVRQK